MPKQITTRSRNHLKYYVNILGAAYHGEPLDFKNWKGVTYSVFGKEICPTTKNEHLQYYVEFRTRKKFESIKRRYPKLHFEQRDGTAQQAADYCKKGEGQINDPVNAIVTEWGEMTQQGERTDLTDWRDHILSGTLSVEDILILNPFVYHQYGRTLIKLEQYYLRTVFRTEMTRCTWYWGPTGTGKSHTAFEGYNPETHYVYPYDKGWWDGYRNQETVIINEFRGQITYSRMLELVDKWPTTCRHRNMEPRPFVAKHIIVTSALHPVACYPKLSNLFDGEGIDQLLRRIDIKKMVTPYQVEQPVIEVLNTELSEFFDCVSSKAAEL